MPTLVPVPGTGIQYMCIAIYLQYVDIMHHAHHDMADKETKKVLDARDAIGAGSANEHGSRPFCMDIFIFAFRLPLWTLWSKTNPTHYKLSLFLLKSDLGLLRASRGHKPLGHETQPSPAEFLICFWVKARIAQGTCRCFTISSRRLWARKWLLSWKMTLAFAERFTRWTRYGIFSPPCCPPVLCCPCPCLLAGCFLVLEDCWFWED